MPENYQSRHHYIEKVSSSDESDGMDEQYISINTEKRIQEEPSTNSILSESQLSYFKNNNMNVVAQTVDITQDMSLMYGDK